MLLDALACMCTRPRQRISGTRRLVAAAGLCSDSGSPSLTLRPMMSPTHAGSDTRPGRSGTSQWQRSCSAAGVEGGQQGLVCVGLAARGQSSASQRSPRLTARPPARLPAHPPAAPACSTPSPGRRPAGRGRPQTPSCLSCWLQPPGQGPALARRRRRRRCRPRARARHPRPPCPRLQPAGFHWLLPVPGRPERPTARPGRAGGAACSVAASWGRRQAAGALDGAGGSGFRRLTGAPGLRLGLASL